MFFICFSWPQKSAKAVTAAIEEPATPLATLNVVDAEVLSLGDAVETVSIVSRLWAISQIP